MSGSGTVWAVGSHGGDAATAVFDGRRWLRQSQPGISWEVYGSFEDRDGGLWFIAPRDDAHGRSGGILSYLDGSWTRFTPPYAVPWDNRALAQTTDGTLWLAGRTSLHRYAPGDPGQPGTWLHVRDVPEDLDTRLLFGDGLGGLWIGGWGLGLYRAEKAPGAADSLAFRHFDTGSGLAHDNVVAMARTRDGGVWAATTAGVSRYDGQSWTTRVLPGDLPLPAPRGLVSTGSGNMWINVAPEPWFSRAAPGAPPQADEDDRFMAIRYRPDTQPPETQITFALEEVPQSGITTITWSGVDPWLTTAADALQYAWRLNDGPWSAFSAETSHLFLSLDSGGYSFQVKARDLDFNEDPTPAVAVFTVLPPVWRQPWFIALMLLSVGLISVQTYRVFAAKQRPLEEAEEELRTAHAMQMRLMPTAPPAFGGFDVAGRCDTESHVGGDFYQYFPGPDSLFIALADVTGKAMDAAIPVVMFSGILDTVMQDRPELVQLLPRLNRSLHRNLDSRTFICFEIAQIDRTSRTVRYANGGLPYPYHVSAGELSELQMDAYPLGVRPDTAYEVIERRLSPGDYLVFCSDGIAEAERESGEQFGYDRASAAVAAACREGLSAAGVIDRLLAAVAAFKQGTPQTDDMTCVVVRVEGDVTS